MGTPSLLFSLKMIMAHEDKPGPKDRNRLLSRLLSNLRKFEGP
jgi:hypothetical protein